MFPRLRIPVLDYYISVLSLNIALFLNDFTCKSCLQFTVLKMPKVREINFLENNF